DRAHHVAHVGAAGQAGRAAGAFARVRDEHVAVRQADLHVGIAAEDGGDGVGVEERVGNGAGPGGVAVQRAREVHARQTRTVAGRVRAADVVAGAPEGVARGVDLVAGQGEEQRAVGGGGDVGGRVGAGERVEVGVGAEAQVEVDPAAGEADGVRRERRGVVAAEAV